MLRVVDLSMEFRSPGGAPVQAVDRVSFEVKKGALFTLLGPSGCGKTTTLRSIAGLERPTQGEIHAPSRCYLDTRRNVFVPPSHRDIGMVFQSYAIWPHMTVFENVAFPLRASGNRRGLSSAELRRAVAETLEIVDLSGYEGRPATKLSGGQQQRLAFARALILAPKLLLLDEPLSNLDAKLREAMRFELKRLQERVGITTIYVTHDQTEALALSDQIAVMKDGRIVQLGSPLEIYSRPQSHFVANFIGTSNFVTGRIVECKNGAVLVDSPHARLVCSTEAAFGPGQEVCVSFRPEDVTIHREPKGGANSIEALVDTGIFVGEARDYELVVGALRVRARVHPSEIYQRGDRVFLEFAPDNCVVLPNEGTATETGSAPRAA